MASIRVGIQMILLAAGASMLILGLANGDAAAVFRKAVIVCMECIGIG